MVYGKSKSHFDSWRRRNQEKQKKKTQIKTLENVNRFEQLFLNSKTQKKTKSQDF